MLRRVDGDLHALIPATEGRDAGLAGRGSPDDADSRGLGQNDPLAPLTCGQALFELLVATTPRARMYIFNQAGHYPYREHPDEFNAVVTSFVDFWTHR